VEFLQNEYNLTPKKSTTINLLASDDPESLRQKAKEWLDIN
jgi:glutamate racemase